MRVALTGSSGQLGSLVLRRLLDRRDVTEVVALDLRPPLAPKTSKLRAVRADVRDPQIAAHLAGCDALIHLAFIVARRATRELQQDVNVEGSKNVFRAAAQAGVQRVVYASSVAAYGVVPGHALPIVESAPRVHQDGFWYAAMKHEVEAFLDSFEAEHPAISIARMRPAILVGRRMEHRLGDAFRRGLMPDLGGAAPPIVWDEDVADAFVLGLEAGARGAFNLAAAGSAPSHALAAEAKLRHVRIPRLVSTLLDAQLLSRLRLIAPMDPGWNRSTGIALTYSTERALAELAWKPRCPTSLSVMRRLGETVPRKADTRLSLLFAVLDGTSRLQKPRSELAGMDETVHLDLTGPGGGDFTLRAQGGRLRAYKGAPRPPDASVTLEASLLLDLLAGRADFTSSQLTGKIRVEGHASAGLMLAALVTAFRSAGKQPGARGMVGRALSRFVSKGASA